MRWLRLFVVLIAALFTLGDRAPGATAYLTVDSPSCCTVKQTFTISGATLGADVVHVWGFPTSGAVFLGSAATDGPDPIRQLSSGGFRIFVQQAPVGTYPIVVYAHDPQTNTFPTSIGMTFTVQACSSIAIDWPFMGPGGMVTFWFVLACA